MSRILFAALLIATILVQATILPRINPFPITPDFSVVLLFFWVLKRSLRESLAWIFLAGVFMDFLGLDPIGLHALALLPVLLVARPFHERPWQVNPISALIAGFVASLFQSVALHVLRGQMPSTDNAVQAAMQTALVPFVYIAFRVLSRR